MPGSALLPALLAGTACVLALRSPGAGLRRIGRADVASVAPPGPDGALGRLVRGRPDAPSVRQRTSLSALAAAAGCLAVDRWLGAAGTWVWLLAPVLSVAGVLALGRLEPGASQRRQRQLVREVPQALELMADGLAAGRPLRQACAAVVDAFDGPVAQDLATVQRAVQLGVPDARAWRTLETHPQLGPAAADLARSVDAGTELVTALRQHAEAARARRRAALQEAARAVGVRSVLPLMVCFLPAFLLLGVVPTVASAVQNAFG